MNASRESYLRTSPMSIINLLVDILIIYPHIELLVALICLLAYDHKLLLLHIDDFLLQFHKIRWPTFHKLSTIRLPQHVNQMMSSDLFYLTFPFKV